MSATHTALLVEVRDLLRRVESELAATVDVAPDLMAAIADEMRDESGPLWFAADELGDHARTVGGPLLRELEKVSPTLEARSIGWALLRLEKMDHPNFIMERGSLQNGSWLRRVIGRGF